MGRQHSQPVHKSSGRSTGLGVMGFFAMLFETNELLATKKKLTDEMILSKAKAEFPGRKLWSQFGPKTTYKYTVNGYARQKYNSGALTRKVPPEKMSFRYDALGRAVEPRYGRTPLPQEEVSHLKRVHAAKHLLATKKLLKESK